MNNHKNYISMTNEEHQPPTAVWQNGGFSAKLNIWFSNIHQCLIESKCFKIRHFAKLQNVMHKTAGQIRCFEHWHFCLPHFPPRHQSKQMSQSFLHFDGKYFILWMLLQTFHVRLETLTIN